MKKKREIIQEALGEVSALFMSQGNTPAGQITMPTEDLVRIADDTVNRLNELGLTYNLVEELRKDKSEGSYYYGWQANIAMAMYDELNGKATKEECNKGAKRFLEILIMDSQK